MKKGTFVRLFPALKHLNIPNAITTMGLVFGIGSCYFLTQRNLRLAILSLFFAGVMDAVDGFVASKLDQQTTFGQYVDTLVDFFTCCIIPIWMVFDLLIDGTVRGSLAVVLGLVFYCVCGLWRLAYYNIIEADKYFTGLPVPGAMMIVTITVWLVYTVPFGIDVPVWAAGIMFFVVGLLMVSGIELRKYGLWQKTMAGLGICFLILMMVV